MPPGMPQPSTEHTQGMTADGGIEIAAKTMASWKAEGMRGMRGMRSDYDAVIEELAAQGRLTTGLQPRCDHCGSNSGTLSPWDWPGRPDGITLHSSCEAPWFDSEGRRQ
jgi:hypothetical protein